MIKDFCGVVLALALFPAAPALAQRESKSIATQQQTWLGYMTQLRVSDTYSLWNDFHLVPEGFYVLRTGLSYHFNERVTATAGYAFLGLPVGTLTQDLKRQEHRPWGQLVVNVPIAPNWSFTHRFRYDMRFRRNVADGQLASGYELTHRPRFLFTLRRNLPALRFGEQLPYVSFGNEVLLNFGSHVVFNRMDQNRVTAGVGVARRGLALQVGYMNRFVQLPSGRDFVMNHTLFLWLFHNIDLRAARDP